MDGKMELEAGVKVAYSNIKSCEIKVGIKCLTVFIQS